MKQLLLLSFKNVVKSRERVILTFLILTFGAMCYTVMSSLLDGLLSASVDETRAEDTADIRIRHANFDEEKAASEDNLFLTNETPLQNAGYTYAPRLFLSAEADNAQDSLPVLFIGIDPQKDAQVLTLKKSNDEPLDDGLVWVGGALARDLGVGEGDYINLTFRSLSGAYISAEYEIGALLSSQLPIYDENAIFVDIADLNNLLNTNVVTYYSVKLDNNADLFKESAKIKELYPNNEVLNWFDMSKETRDTLNVRKQFMNVFILLIMLITLVGLINTILISVWEKRKTTGTLRALGYNNKEIMWLFIFEGAWIGFIGAVLGVLLGVLINIPLVVIGYSVADLIKIEGQSLNVGFTVPPVIHSTWSLSAILIPIIFMPIAAMLVSIYPARKSVKMSIVDCLRTTD
ncbi:MAG: ABC transporter permease [Brevinema sp.]